MAILESFNLKDNQLVKQKREIEKHCFTWICQKYSIDVWLKNAISDWFLNWHAYDVFDL